MSKSVSESRNPAAIGSAKNTPIVRRAGDRNSQAARISCGVERVSHASAATGHLGAASGENPAPLLENPVHVRVEPGERSLHGLAPADRRLHVFLDLLRDLLPLGRAGGGSVVPAFAPGGEIPRQLVETSLDLASRQELDELPGGILLLRRPEDR